jgi:peptidoglycan/xylan/chitin deacetylase (PgdA/CDA1 family)
MWIELTVAGIAGIAVLYIFWPWMVKTSLRKKFLRVASKSSGICLTFDDGPDPVFTPTVLDMLAKSNAKATFFPIGKNVERYPDLMKRIVKEGHELGEHGYTHKHPWVTGPYGTWLDVWRGGHQLATYARNGAITLFRPPYGKLNLVSMLYIFLNRKIAVFWNLDPKDYRLSSENTTPLSIQEQVSNGTVILFHDGRCGIAKSGHETTLKVLELVLESARNKGLKPITINELYA